MFDFLRNITKSAEEKRQEALSAYLSDALSPKERRQFEAQLAQDPGLQAELEQLQALRQAMRQMPRRRVPRNFTLDPAVYGRPARQPLIQAYPILRGATAITAVFLIFTLAAGLFAGLGSSAQPMAVEMAPAAEVALEAPAVVEEGETVEVTRVVTEIVVEAEAADSAAEEMEIPAKESPAEEAPAATAPLAEVAATKAAAPDSLAGAEEAAMEEESLPAPAPTMTPTPKMTPTPAGTAVPLAQATLPAASSRQAGDSEVSNGQPQVSVEPTVMAFEAEEIGGEETAVSPLSALTPLQWLQLGLLLLLLVLAAITLYARRQLK